MEAGFAVLPCGKSKPIPLSWGVACDVAVGRNAQVQASRRVATQIVLLKTIAIYESVQCHRSAPQRTRTANIIGRNCEGLISLISPAFPA